MGNKSSIKKRGGALTSDDIVQINSLIDSRLQTFHLIPIEKTEVVLPSTTEVVSPSTTAVFAKANILEKKIRDPIIENESFFAQDRATQTAQRDAYSAKKLEKSDVYFHMVKITSENIETWKIFEAKIKEITPIRGFDNLDGRGNGIWSGLDYFVIKERNDDLFVAYASKVLNKTNNPPDWKDVECMVTVIAKEGIPYFTYMGIFALLHTYDNEFFYEANRISYLGQELKEYLVSINYSYPSHKYISMHLFTFIGTHIKAFYAQCPIALLTSPVETIKIIAQKIFDPIKLPFGYETEGSYNNRHSGSKNGQYIQFDMYNNTSNFKDTNMNSSKALFFKLTRDKLQISCPWYCNIFPPYPENTTECYRDASAIARFLYIPVYSFEELAKLEEYYFEDIF